MNFLATKSKSPPSRERCENGGAPSVRARHDINHVLLLHLGAFSSTILPDALDLPEQKGFKFVTLEEAESDPAYETDPDAGSKYGETLLEQWMDARKIKYPPVAEKPYKELREICQ